MAQTSEILLDRLREHPDDAEAWQRLDALYRPFLHHCLRQYHVQSQDADDLIQQVFAVAVRELSDFHFDPCKGSLKGWLRGILSNRLREFWRSRRRRRLATGDSDVNDRILDEVVNHRNDPDRAWDQQHAKYVAQRLLARIEPDFSATTWQAFQRIMAGDKAADVAADLKISVNAVYLAKSAVLKRLRQEMRNWAE